MLRLGGCCAWAGWRRWASQLPPPTERSTGDARTEIAEQIVTERGARRARLRALWQLSPGERVAAMRRGEFSLEQCAAWAARYPEQVPLLNGEFEFLAAFTPEVLG